MRLGVILLALVGSMLLLSGCSQSGGGDVTSNDVKEWQKAKGEKGDEKVNEER